MQKRRRRSSKPVESGPRKRSRHLEDVQSVGTTDYELLGKFVTEHGKIIPSRLTGASAKQQRQIKRGVRRARQMGILP